MKMINNMRMNKLAFTRRFTFAVLSLLITANLWGQAALSGSGTEESPYQITSVADWNIFANEANAATYWASGVYVQLDDNISVSSMVGTSSNMYKGTFDGNWHTLTIDLTSTGENTAPFSVVDGARIKNLTIAGDISTSHKYTGGLIGRAYNHNDTIISCISKVNITSSINGDGTHGGFVGELSTNNVKMYFKNCIFEGSITGDNTSKVAGFIGYSGGKSEITDCIMAGNITANGNTATFLRTRTAQSNHVLTRAYYTTNYNAGVDYGPAGTEAYTNASHEDLNNKIYIKYHGTHFIPGAEITGLEQTVFQYTGSNITITPVVKFYGWTLNSTDYTISIEKKNGSVYETVENIKEAGDYHYIISGVSSYGYGGSHVTEIKVIQLNSWAALVEAMSSSNGTFDLTQNIIAENPRTTDTALVVTGNITLNLNNFTINRNLTDTIVYGQVIRVKKGANLTINGPGNIKGGYSWTGPYNSILDDDTEYYDKRDAGGIHNMGDLVLNNVTIDHNKCVKEAEGSESYSARGGGIYSGNGSSLRIYGGRIYGNEAKGGGGGVYSAGANPFVMDGVHINGNESESKGGGVRVKTTGGKIAYLTDCTIEANFVEANAAQGAGIFMEGGRLVMTRCDITSNQADHQGCGFYSSQGTTTAKDCNIYYNGTHHEDGNNIGAGIYLNNGSTYIMDGGTIEGNNCVKDGGGIYVANGAVFQVKGNVKIRDNYKASIGPGATDNNAYLAGTSVIEVVGELGEDAIIHITPSSNNRCYVEVAEGVLSADVISHLKVDDIWYDMIIDSDNIVVYKSYSWKETTTWDGTIAENSSGAGTIPTADSDLKINRTLTIPKGCTAYAKSITMGSNVHIYIEDGGELITSNDNVDVSVRKDIVKGTSAGKGWYLISSSVNGAIIDEKTNLITIDYENHNTYDLYRFNEAAELQWENYRAGHADFTTLQNGRGYLYRNKSAYTVIIDGTLNVSDVTYTLSCSGSELTGFNIIGNPYSHTIYKGVETEDVHPAIPNGTLLEGKYYVLDAETGKWALTDDGTAIPPMTGILVQAKSAGTLTMKNSTEGEVVPESKNSRANGADRKNIWFTVANSNYEDRTCVEFREGHGLNKIAHENENIQMLYIHHNGEDFASVDMNPEAKMFNLNFEAKTMGYYTLSVKPQGSYSYLHLIDKVTEKEIDLLEENEYTFIGSTSDAANRFIVRMSLAEDPEESDNEVFAYQSGDEIVVTGEGELQVFDVMGRFVATYNVSGVQTVTKPITAGVYIVKLNEKTQKIIIK